MSISNQTAVIPQSGYAIKNNMNVILDKMGKKQVVNFFHTNPRTATGTAYTLLLGVNVLFNQLICIPANKLNSSIDAKYPHLDCKKVVSKHVILGALAAISTLAFNLILVRVTGFRPSNYITKVVLPILAALKIWVHLKAREDFYKAKHATQIVPATEKDKSNTSNSTDSSKTDKLNDSNQLSRTGSDSVLVNPSDANKTPPPETVKADLVQPQPVSTSNDSTDKTNVDSTKPDANSSVQKTTKTWWETIFGSKTK